MLTETIVDENMIYEMPEVDLVYELEAYHGVNEVMSSSIKAELSSESVQKGSRLGVPFILVTPC